ncbi:MAG: carotenoid oxygenase family protein [Alphaproteobacteria bacterium]|nr:carotenoid oxygenase family protein [Alphaproteobacteria bacterium]
MSAQAGSHPWSGGFRSLETEHDGPVTEVSGRVPDWLRGTLYRNGSGRNQLAGQWFPHWFDGDGMVSAIRFGSEGIRYRNRYIATTNYVDETKAQAIRHRGFGKMRPGGTLANVFRQPGNVSNTSVIVQDGRLLSLWEGGPPYELEPATLATRGVADFGGKLKAFSAHPKRDPETGELFNFGIDYGPKTTLTPYRLKDGATSKLPVVTLPYPLMNHDFVLTKRHLVFCLGPILLRSLKMVLGLESFDRALHWEGGKPTLILLVPRDGGPSRLIETDAFFQFHFANGYETDGAIALDLARYPDFNVIGEALRSYWRSEWPAAGMATFSRLTIDLVTGRTTTKAFAAGNANEFPTINPARTGRSYRFAYIACSPADRPIGLQQQLARIDVESGAVTRHDFGPHGYPGEPLFVARPGGSEEDDGAVLTLVYDAASERSAVVGLDARDLAAAPLFTARLSHHVPYSLHGCFAAA